MKIIDARATEGFDCDEGNIHKNRLKHDVDTSECEEAFFNEPCIFFNDNIHFGETERRYKVLGITGEGRQLALAITLRGNKIRVIMARDQSHKERILFEKDEL